MIGPRQRVGRARARGTSGRDAKLVEPVSA